MVVLMVTIGTWMAMYFRTSWTSCGFSLTRRRRFLPKPCCTHCVRKTVATTTRILCDQDISKCDRVRQGRAATYQRHNHQHIVDTKLANFDLCKHSQDNDDHGDDHCGPDAPYEGRPRCPLRGPARDQLWSVSPGPLRTSTEPCTLWGDISRLSGEDNIKKRGPHRRSDHDRCGHFGRARHREKLRHGESSLNNNGTEYSSPRRNKRQRLTFAAKCLPGTGSSNGFRRFRLRSMAKGQSESWTEPKNAFVWSMGISHLATAKKGIRRRFSKTLPGNRSKPEPWIGF